MNNIRVIVVLVMFGIIVQGISAGYPGFFAYQQPARGFFPPPPVYYQPRPTLRYDIEPVQSPPQHYYSPPPANKYRGFSYETRYQAGARSHVVYVTGPQSHELMQRSFAEFRNVLPLTPAQPISRALPATQVSDANSTSTTVVNPSTPAPFPRQFIPAFNMPQFIPPPFPYRSFASPFFHAIPPQFQQNSPPASGSSGLNVEPASEVQESMRLEVSVPEVISNRISDIQEVVTATPAVGASSVSTASSIEATTPLQPIVVTEAQTESSSASAAPAAAITEAATEPSTAAAVTEAAAAAVTEAAAAAVTEAAAAAVTEAAAAAVTEAAAAAVTEAATEAPAAAAAATEAAAAAATEAPATPATPVAPAAEEPQATEETTSAPANEQSDSASATVTDAAQETETITEAQAAMPEAETETTPEETTTVA